MAAGLPRKSVNLLRCGDLSHELRLAPGDYNAFLVIQRLLLCGLLLSVRELLDELAADHQRGRRPLFSLLALLLRELDGGPARSVQECSDPHIDIVRVYNYKRLRHNYNDL